MPKDTLLLTGKRLCEKHQSQHELRWQAIDQAAHSGFPIHGVGASRQSIRLRDSQAADACRPVLSRTLRYQNRVLLRRVSVIGQRLRLFDFDKTKNRGLSGGFPSAYAKRYSRLQRQRSSRKSRVSPVAITVAQLGVVSPNPRKFRRPNSSRQDGIQVDELSIAAERCRSG
jgi:hypothetical protein